jgi:protein ERP2
MKLLYLSIFVSLIDFINSVELTFELPDNDKQCYYQDIEKNRTAILEYQVSGQFF